jgi:phosphopantothenate synthetase
MVEAEDLGQEGPERHQRTEDAVTEADLVFVQNLVDGGRVEQVVKRELGRVAELIDLLGNPTARTLGHGWPPC